MPTITYDSRSFMVDGRRIWVVSGSIPFGRIPRDQWAERIHSAKLAGLNTIETPVYWNRHEPRPGKLDFTGENDLRHFVKLVQAAGLYALIRVGPFVGGDWDMGGLPAWILDLKDVKVRAVSATYLDACARFLGATVDQIKDLQVTSPGRGGPIIGVQCESGWSCGDDALAAHYLGELNRFLREGGLGVPIINSNNLWQTVEGEIDGWAGDDDMLATMRQLSCVRADQPRIVISFGTGESAAWNRERSAPVEPWRMQRRLAEILAGGGQFNLDPFCAGAAPGFFAGRSPDGRETFACPVSVPDAPLTETGSSGAALAMIRRISMFASRFGKVFANLDPGYQPITLHPGAGRVATGKKGSAGGQSGHVVVHSMGVQGAVVFVFSDGPHGADAESAHLLLPEGVTLPVRTGTQGVSWCLFDTNLTARAHLDYTNLNAFAQVGKLFVCYGPAKSAGVVSINGASVEQSVPTPGATPATLEHEGIQVVMLCEEQIDSTYATEDTVYVGVVGLTPDDRPIVAPGTKSFVQITGEGVVSVKQVSSPKTQVVVAGVGAPGDRATIGEWSAASLADYVTGESARFASIAGPQDLTSLGSPFGYGWYRVTLRPAANAKVDVAFPQSGDRLHVYLDGKEAGVVGALADGELGLSLRKGQQQMVVLAENFGRFAGGTYLGEGKGLFGHAYAVEQIKPGKAKVQEGEPIEVLGFRSPLWEVRPGDATDPDRVTWSLTHKKKTPVIVRIGAVPVRGLLLVDSKPVAFVDSAGPTNVLLDAERFGKSSTLIQLAVLNDGDALSADQLEGVCSAVTFHDAVSVISAKSEWAFAKWEPPNASAFRASKGASPPRGDGPVWWKAPFKSIKTPAPLFLEGTGLTKGQVYINGRHLSRYFVSTGDGKPVAGQARYLIPSPWLRASGDNEIMIFDEHGASPTKCRLVYEHTLTPLCTGVPMVV